MIYPLELILKRAIIQKIKKQNYEVIWNLVFKVINAREILCLSHYGNTCKV